MPYRSTRRAFALGLLALLPLSTAWAQSAEAWPARQVKLLVGSSPGGGTDAMARAVAAATDAEREGVPGMTVFAGFCLADIPAPCMSVVATVEATVDGEAQALAGRHLAERAGWRAGTVLTLEGPGGRQDAAAEARSRCCCRRPGRRRR